MASKKQIGAIIKLEGEQTFKASIQNCKANISALKAELKNIQSAYSGNANSLEALSAMQEKYSEIQKVSAAQVDNMTTAYERSKESEKRAKDAMQQMLEVYNKAEAELKEMKASGNASAEAMEEQAKKASDAYEMYNAYAAQVEKAGTRTNRFRKALTEAKTEEREASEAVKLFASYVKEAQESTDGAATSIDKYGNAVGDVAESAGAAGSSFEVMRGVFGANLATEGLKKVIELLKTGAEYAVEVGSNFEQAMSKVQALSGAEGSELTALRDKAQDLGRETQFSATEIADGFSYMSLAGWNAQQQLAAIPGVVNLAASAEMDLASASDMVTDYLSAFGLSAEYASTMADMLAYAQANSNTTAEQLGEAWKNSAANMHAAGQTITTTTALLEALANQGRKGSESGSSLAATLRDVTSKMKDGAITIGDTSIAVEDSTGNFRDLIDILGDVEKATEGMGSAQRSAALSAVFTDDSIKAVNMVLNEGVDKVKGYKEALTDCDGAAESMASTMNDNLKGSMKECESALEGLGIAAYNYVDGPLSSVVDGVTDALNSLTDAITPQKTELDTFVDIVDEANTKIQNMMGSANSKWSTDDSSNSKMREYIGIIEDARGKTSLTQYETYRLNEAIKYVSQSVPTLNKYIGDTNSLLKMSASDFKEVRDSMVQSYGDMVQEALSAKRNTLMQAKVEADVNLQQAISARETMEQTIEEEQKKFEKIQKEMSLIDPSDRSTLWAKKRELEEEGSAIAELQGKYKDYQYEVVKASNTYSDATSSIEDMDSANTKLYSKYGLYVDAQGNLTSATQEAKKAQEESENTTSDSIDTITDATDATEDLSKTVEGMAQTYAESMKELKNADPSEAIRSQLAAAAEQVSSFQESVKSSFSGFSLFGDATNIMDIYTSSSKTEMQKNARLSLDIMGKYADELKNLKDRGMSQEFLEYLTSQGQAGLEYVHNLATWTSDEELKAFQEQFDQYESYTTGANERVKSLMADYADAVMSGVTDGYETWKQYGIQTTQGLFDALQEAQDALTNGTLTGDLNNAIQVVLQNRQTQSKVSNLAPRSNTEIQRVQNNTPKRNENTETRLTVNLVTDGKTLAQQVINYRNENGRITGRR